MLDRRRRGSRGEEFHCDGHEPVHRREQRPNRRLHGYPDRVHNRREEKEGLMEVLLLLQTIAHVIIAGAAVAVAVRLRR